MSPPHPDGPTYQMEGFTSAVFRAASQGSDPSPHLNIQGPTLDDLTDQLAALIDEAGRSGDYSQLLSPERSFAV